MKKQLRVGIYAGAFDPVHAGHVTFALQAIEEAKLDKIFFLPERRPRHKQGVEHFGHRVAMLKQACQPHPRLSVLELVDVSFSVERTLPKLRQQFASAELVFLFGSDAITSLPQWPKSEHLLKSSELAIGVRTGADIIAVESSIAAWPVQPKAWRVFESYAPDISSGKVREGLRRRQPVRGLLKSVARYSNLHWLYVSLR